MYLLCNVMYYYVCDFMLYNIILSTLGYVMFCVCMFIIYIYIYYVYNICNVHVMRCYVYNTISACNVSTMYCI